MLREVNLAKTTIDSTFWNPRLDANQQQSIAHNIKWCESTGRIANFEKVAAGKTSGHEGWFFNDSDVYKVIEGVAYCLVARPNPEIEGKMDEWIEKIGAAQANDGYLHTFTSLTADKTPWAEDQFHELYCTGHLIEAGLAYYEATGKKRLFEIALKNVDLINDIFGSDKKLMAPEHPEIELALIRLWQHTKDNRHLELAKFFVEQRGHHEARPSWKTYAQDHLPVRQQTEIVGHAVRAMYLMAAVTDLAGITDDTGFNDANEAIWKDLTERKLYVTGGTGVWGYNEGFAPAYDLPNERSYAETCASISLALWGHRLARLNRDAKYADIFERVLFNGILSGVALTGNKYLYANPLASHGVSSYQSGSGGEGESCSHRKEWFTCACCPPNVLRFLASLATRVCAFDSESVYVNLYVAGTSVMDLGSGQVTLTQTTNYPWDGRVDISIDTTNKPAAFDLFLRIPQWSHGAQIFINGEEVNCPDIVRGYAHFESEWKTGDTITLDLPMPVERIQSNPRILANAGRIALQRGPLVYCLESADNPEGVWNVALPDDVEMTSTFDESILGGVTLLQGKGLRRVEGDWDAELYRQQPSTPPETTETAVTAIPYCLWDNRTPGEMIVWIPKSPEMAE